MTDPRPRFTPKPFTFLGYGPGYKPAPPVEEFADWDDT